MLTTPRDYATFLSALMRGEVLSPVARDRMLNPQIRIHSAYQFPSLNTDTTTAYDPIELSYGLGWGLYKSPYGPAFFKEGHDEGWRNLALCFSNGDGMLVMTNSSNGEGIFRPLAETLLGETAFPFDRDGYTPHDTLAPLPKLKEHKPVTLTADQLDRLAGKYALTAGIVLSVNRTSIPSTRPASAASSPRPARHRCLSFISTTARTPSSGACRSRRRFQRTGGSIPKNGSSSATFTISI